MAHSTRDSHRRHRRSRVSPPLSPRMTIHQSNNSGECRYTALQHSLSCTPLVHDLTWSQILLDASQDPIAAINHRNRYGATGIHETVMCYRREGEEEIRLQVLEWALARGVNMDSEWFAFRTRELLNFMTVLLMLNFLSSVLDNDGSTPRATGTRFPSLLEAMERADLGVATDGGCAFCRRGAVRGKGKGKVTDPKEGEIRASLRCSRCRNRVCSSFFLSSSPSCPVQGANCSFFRQKRLLSWMSEGKFLLQFRLLAVVLMNPLPLLSWTGWRTNLVANPLEKCEPVLYSPCKVTMNLHILYISTRSSLSLVANVDKGFNYFNSNSFQRGLILCVMLCQDHS